MSPDEGPLVPWTGGAETCEACGQACESRAALRAHAREAHPPRHAPGAPRG